MRTLASAVALLALSGMLAHAAKPPGAGNGKPGSEPVGNNLSMPVIWGDGMDLTIRNQSTLDDGSNAPTPADNLGDVLGQTTVVLDGVTYYPQGVALNDWGADTFPSSNPNYDDNLPPAVFVKEVDWGDNLESVDWRTSSPVRIEVTLYDKPGDPSSPNYSNIRALTGYPMRSLGGTTRNEVFGTTGVQYSTADTSTDPSQNYEATIYSSCARLVMQRLLVPRDKPGGVVAEWDGSLWSGVDIDHQNLLPADGAVWAAGDGPGYFSSEVNASGKVIYGLPWTVTDYVPGSSFTDYRITFELDSAGMACAPDGLHTSLEKASIRLPAEETEVATTTPNASKLAALAVETGGVAEIDGSNNISWIDIRVTDRASGGGKGKGGGGQGNGGGKP